MNLSQILALSSNKKVYQPEAFTSGGTIGFSTTPMQRTFRSGPLYIPGFTSGGPLGWKRRKRDKVGRERTQLERVVHDLYIHNHRDKRRKLVEKAALAKSSVVIEKFLSDVHGGKFAKPRSRKATPERKRPRVEEEEKTPRIKPAEEKLEEKAYEPDVTPDPPVTPAPRLIEEPATPPTPDQLDPRFETPKEMGPSTPSPPPTPPKFHEARREFKEGISAEGQRRGRAEAEITVRKQRREDVMQERREAMEPVEETRAPPQIARAEIPSEMDVETTAEPATILETKAPPPVARAEIPSEMDVETTAEPTEATILKTEPPDPLEEEDIDIVGAEMEEDKPDPKFQTPARKTKGPVPTPISTGVPDPISTGRPDDPVKPKFTGVPKRLQFAEPIEEDDEPRFKHKKRVVKKDRPVAVPSIKARTAAASRGRLRGQREALMTKARVQAQVPHPPPPQVTTKTVSRPEPKKQVAQTRALFKAGLQAIRKKQRSLGLKPKLTIQRAEPITVAPVQPPRKDEPLPDLGIRMPKKKLTISKAEEVSVPGKERTLEPSRTATSFPVKERKLESARKAVSFPRPKRTLQPSSTAVSFPTKEPKKASPKKASPKKASPKKRRSPKRVRFAGRGADMKVAPTQQVSVTPTMQASQAGLGALSSKIDELLKATKESKLKKKRTSAYSAAKKQFKAYRTKALANVKAENASIKKRELVKINKLPVKTRAAARKRLKEMLKARVDKVKNKLPSRIKTPGQLSSLMQAFRTLKV